MKRRVLCAHADQNGVGAHWKLEGEPCAQRPDRTFRAFEPTVLHGRVGGSVIACPNCGEERWYGYGPCGKCRSYLPNEGASND